LPERHEPREDVRALVRALVDEAVAPLLRITIQLEHRIQRLEERPLPAPVYVAQPAAPAAAYGGQLQSHAAAISSPPQVVPPAPILNVAAIERDVHIHVDGGLDGSKRRFRLVLTLVLLLVVAFGGLFAALAQSYAPPR
jgi:hypothetical protein